MGDGGHLYCESVTIQQHKNIAQIFLHMRQTSPYSLYNTSYTSMLPLPFLIYIFTFCGPPKTITANRWLDFFFFLTLWFVICAVHFSGDGVNLVREDDPCRRSQITSSVGGAWEPLSCQIHTARTGARCCVLESKRGREKHRLVSSKCQVFREKMTVQNLFSGGLRLSF